MTEKTCRICRQLLPIDHFYMLWNNKFHKRYPNSYCKQCGNKKRADYAQSKPSKELIRRRNLKTYGITVESYERMLADQRGLCAICGSEESHVSPYSKSSRRLCVDHDHVTGKIRGLLCSRCNRALGLLGDRLENITAVLRYILLTQQH